ncbi:hypothetical protein BDY19DRAFT_989825 [Irpex rosettiformis]|uniref:Uncharacterized protein n=1 Tax=Irpex rosettiformis TaxID=378272 RepID=A0ACB8UFG5_9APHY|nr:hypothetical protein BDY19DRAFT_989825 [Irpex rosettiformis]
MRQSTAPLRQSNPASNTKQLLEKKKEFDAVLALDRASTQFLKRIEGLADDFDDIADAGIVHGRVLEQWPNMFRILNIFLSSREQASGAEDNELEGERLVRIPIEELQNTERST